MGKIDAVTKKYIGRPDIFADVFNQYVYRGASVIRPERLRELDATQVVLPYGSDEITVPVQKFRDVEKLMLSMTDGKTAYCLLGIENQSEIHYAMPVKSGLYDFMQLSGEVEKTAGYHRKEHHGASDGEFLGGFHKEDRLIPVVTLVFYFGADKWDGPRSLHEMYADCAPELLRYAPDYRINLISPYEMSDAEIGLYQTNVREILLYIKHSADKKVLPGLIRSNERFSDMDREAVDLINKVTGSRISVQAGKERVDMCAGFEGALEDSKLAGKQEGLREGIQQGIQKGLQTGQLSAARSMIEKLKMTAEQALEVLGIPEDERAGYLAKL